MRYFISISYRGAGYSGWQIQNNASSIEGVLEKAISTLLATSTDLTGAGRTDTGVNALNYIAHFDSENEILIKEPEMFLYKLNAILPLGICVNHLFPVKKDAHARFDAVSRTYQYFVHSDKDPFCYDFSYFYKFPLNIDSMNTGAQYLLGENDFSCFEKLHGGNVTSICNISQAYWKIIPKGDQIRGNGTHLVFTITANRFLRNMVRAIVGSLLEIGRGRKEPEWIGSLIEGKKRDTAGQSVPGYALTLTEIKYPYNFNETILK